MSQNRPGSWRRRPALAIIVFASLIPSPATIGEPAAQYREPAAEVTALLTADRPPEFRLHSPSRRVALVYHEPVIGIERLMRPRLGLAGFRFDPAARTSGIYPLITRIELLSVDRTEPALVWRPAGGALLDFVQFSPDGRWLSALALGTGPARLVLFDIDSGKEQALSADINAAWGNPCSWAGGDSLLCRMLPEGPGPAPSEFAAPTIIEHQGDAEPVRTFPNLLKNGYDDALFEHYFAVGFARIRTDGSVARIPALDGLISKFDASPDGSYAIVSRVESPYSRLLTARRFPSSIEVWDLDKGRRLYESGVANAEPGIDDEVPESRERPRRAAWKAGSPVTLGYIESSTDSAGKELHRWMEIDEPFTGTRREVVTSEVAIKQFGWTSAGTPFYSVASDDGREMTAYAAVNGQMREIWSGEAGNLYESPGHALTVDGSDGPVREDGNVIYLAGDGQGDGGPRPFLDAFDLGSGQVRRLYEAEPGVFERVLGLLDTRDLSFVTVRETETEAPRPFLRTATRATALTVQSDPYPQLAGVTREVLNYRRADGLALSGTLYLPAGYRKGTPLPTLVWIYPYEFTDRSQAEQLDLRAFRFHQVKGPSPLAAVVAGYAVLMNPTVPIMYEGSTVSDTYLPQLVASLDAAVKHLVELGVSDPARIAVAGRSYGSFSSANLLVHSDLFATAICMSGAYNRTLTPFGFQHEKRSFWEAGSLYAEISPFFHADEVNKPILLIHGGGDENPGTPPMQARRFVHALIGEGATVRYVELPVEGHHYWARENVLLAAAETLDWLDRTIGPKRPAKAVSGHRQAGTIH